MRDEHVIGARWIVRADSSEEAERVISSMLEGLLGEESGRHGYLGTYQSADSPMDARQQSKLGLGEGDFYSVGPESVEHPVKFTP